MCLILSLLLLSQVSAQTFSISQSQPIASTANKIASQYQELGWFSGVVLVSKDNETVFSQAYGMQDFEQGIANQQHTRFNLGSIAKNFTKVLVLQQIQAGRLSLTDKLTDFKLGFQQEGADKITIEHLLNHRAGFVDIFVADYRQNQLAFDTNEKKLKLLIDKPLLFKPGTDQKYSNYGYIVLGAILEKVTQKTYAQLLQENIFDPAGIRSSSLKPVNSDDLQSTRYTYLYDNQVKRVGITEHPGPDGGIESTAADVQRFYRALFHSDTLLNPTKAINRKEFAMDGAHWGAYGGGLGISAAVDVDLVNGYEVVVLANTDNLVAERISGRILSFINSGHYDDITPLAQNFAYQYYQSKGKSKFYQSFKQAYKDAGYTLFIGRTINELGMALIKTKSWQAAFDMFEYLVTLFPSAPQAYDSLAFAYWSKGDKDLAISTFAKALAIDGNFNSEYIGSNYGAGSDSH